MSTTVQDPLGSESASLGGWFSGLRRRVRQGDVGSLPVIAGLVLIWVIFGFLNPNFLSPRNLTNLMLQIAGVVHVVVQLIEYGIGIERIPLSTIPAQSLAVAFPRSRHCSGGWRIASHHPVRS